MNARKKVAFYTLGCKLNFSETSTIARSFVDEGFDRVDFSEKADIFVINTCSVTENADKRFKTIVKQALRSNPEAFIIAVGCYAQLKPEELAEVDGVDLVLGATEKFNITSYINDLLENPDRSRGAARVHSCEIEEAPRRLRGAGRGAAAAVAAGAGAPAPPHRSAAGPGAAAGHLARRLVHAALGVSRHPAG